MSRQKIPNPNDWSVVVKHVNCVHPFEQRTTRSVQKGGDHFAELYCTKCEKILCSSQWGILEDEPSTDPRNSTGKFAALDPSKAVT